MLANCVQAMRSHNTFGTRDSQKGWVDATIFYNQASTNSCSVHNHASLKALLIKKDRSRVQILLQV